MCYAIIDIDKGEKEIIKRGEKKEEIKTRYEELLERICKGVEESFENWFKLYEKAKKEFEEDSKILKSIGEMCNQVIFDPEEIIELRGKTIHTIRLAIRIPGEARNKKIEKRMNEILKEKVPEVLCSKIVDHIKEEDLLSGEKFFLDLPPIFSREPKPTIA